MKQRKSRSYAADMEWVTKQLKAGFRVYCVRSRATGLIVCMMAAKDVPTTKEGGALFSGHHDDYTLTPIMLEDGKPKWGRENPWPGSEPEMQERAELEAGLYAIDRVGTDYAGH